MARTLLRLAGLGLALWVVGGCGGPAAAPPGDGPSLVVLRGETMGTTYTVKFVPPEGRSADDLQGEAQGRIEAALREVNRQMSTYDPESEISRFNRLPAGTWMDVSPGFAEVLGRALEIGRLTGGAFDVTAEPLIALWGFEGRPRGSSPEDSEIEAARARLGLEALELAAGRLRATRPGIAITLAGIAKGYGVDVVARLLESMGIGRSMVEIGGEVRVQGAGPRGGPWRLGINVPSPAAAPDAVLRVVLLERGGLATSGTYRIFFDDEGRRFSHIIDPRTGRPVQHDLVSVSIIAEDCTRADALATAALVMGEERMRELLATLPGTEALFIHQRQDGSFLTSATSGFPLESSPARGRVAGAAG